MVVLGETLWANEPAPLLDTLPGGLPLFVALTLIGQLVYVKVRHGATNEELGFFEVVLAAAILTLRPTAALMATMVGMLLGEFMIRRPRIKVVYNLGMYAASTSVMIIVYHVLFPLLPFAEPESESVFSWQSIASLLIASIAFTAANLMILASLLRAASGVSRRVVLHEEWRLSAFMAIGSAGIGAMAVALASDHDTWALVPFVLLPALALWYAYGAAAQHAEARERNKWLVKLGGLAGPARAGHDDPRRVRRGDPADRRCARDDGPPARGVDLATSVLIASCRRRGRTKDPDRSSPTSCRTGGRPAS